MKTIETKDILKRYKQGELVTRPLQELIYKANREKATLIISKGEYLVSSLYIPSNSSIVFEEGSIVKGTSDESQYEFIETRVAGINMMFYPAILNILDSSNIHISGKGEVRGAGPYFYSKYWGEDKKGGMRKKYDEQGLRWACDYDCFRVRNLLIQNSHDVKIEDLKLTLSGFWNLHVLYSHDIVLSNINIDSFDENAPSTDGIDIDSSHDVLIKGCSISTNDDCIAIKSGRDMDGIRTNIPTYNVEISNCNFCRGFGLTIGSEVSGGIKDINCHDLVFKGSECGFRIKSSPSRKGYIKNINLHNIYMEDVKYPFHFYLNWSILYNKIEVPSTYKGTVRSYWKTLLEEVPSSIPNTKVFDIRVDNVKCRLSPTYKDFSRLFSLIGYEDQKMSDLIFKNLDVVATEYGEMENVENVSTENVNVEIVNPTLNNPKDFDNR